MKFILFILLSTYIFSQQQYPADSLLKSNQISIIKKFGILPISFWQRISYNTTIFDCQFYPSCSNYGSEAIRDFGLIRGGFVAADRITRCNPFAYHYHLELSRPFFEKDGRLIDTIHQKSIKNPMQIRKLRGTLETGLFVGKNVPKLIVTLGKSSKDLLTFAKANEMDTSGADDIELDFE